GWVRHARFIANALDAEHNVVCVFLQGVVNRGLEVGLRAVVVDAATAANIEVAHAGADTVQLDVDARRLVQGVFDVPDIGDLAAQMEMDQLKAVGHASVFEVVKRFDDFGERQTELAAEAGAGAPAARAARSQLDADTQDGLDL